MSIYLVQPAEPAYFALDMHENVMNIYCMCFLFVRMVFIQDLCDMIKPLT